MPCQCNTNIIIPQIVIGIMILVIISLVLLFIILVSYDIYYGITTNSLIDNFSVPQKPLQSSASEKTHNEGEHNEETNNTHNIENANSHWTRNKDCKYLVSSTIAQVLKDYNVTETKNNNFNMYMPCSYNDIKGEINSIPNKDKCSSEYYFIVSNADELTAKDRLWKNLKQLYGQETTNIMPQTYVLYDPNDVEEFNKNYNPNKIYILKKNIQRQEGLKITRNKKEILDAYPKEKYVLVQELLQDPFIIDGRKTNMRFYLLLVCSNGKITAYVHDNGFMYYTADPFVTNTIDHKVNITTGYIDRSVYDKNPLTLEDLRKYIDTNYGHTTNSKVVFNRILDILNKLTKAIGTSVCQDASLYKCNTFQLFGVDVALNDKLMPQIMEVNKGPDLGGKDERDLTIKKKVIADMFNIVGVIHGINDNQFRQVYPSIQYYE